MYNSILLNLAYCIIGIMLMFVSDYALFQMFDRITPFDTKEQLNDKNTAVGLVIGLMILGINIGIGLVIGLALN